MVNATLRKQVAQLQAREGELKKRNDGLESALVEERVARETVEKEVDDQLVQIKSLAVDATLHAHAEMMEEYKVGQQAEWDPDYEIGLWRNRDLELAGGTTEEETPLQVEGPQSDV